MRRGERCPRTFGSSPPFASEKGGGDLRVFVKQRLFEFCIHSESTMGVALKKIKPPFNPPLKGGILICSLPARGRSSPEVRGNRLLRRRTPWESPFGTKLLQQFFERGSCYLSLVFSCIFTMHILYFVCMPSAYSICLNIQ